MLRTELLQWWPWPRRKVKEPKPPAVTELMLTASALHQLQEVVLDQLTTIEKLEVKNDRLMETIRRQTKRIQQLQHKLIEAEETKE